MKRLQSLIISAFAMSASFVLANTDIVKTPVEIGVRPISLEAASTIFSIPITKVEAAGTIVDKAAPSLIAGIPVTVALTNGCISFAGQSIRKTPRNGIEIVALGKTAAQLQLCTQEVRFVKVLLNLTFTGASAIEKKIVKLGNANYAVTVNKTEKKVAIAKL